MEWSGITQLILFLIITVSTEVATVQGMPLATHRHTPVGLGLRGISQRAMGQNFTYFCTNLPGETPNLADTLYMYLFRHYQGVTIKRPPLRTPNPRIRGVRLLISD